MPRRPRDECKCTCNRREFSSKISHIYLSLKNTISLFEPGRAVMCVKELAVEDMRLELDDEGRRELEEEQEEVDEPGEDGR